MVFAWDKNTKGTDNMTDAEFEAFFKERERNQNRSDRLFNLSSQSSSSRMARRNLGLVDADGNVDGSGGGNTQLNSRSSSSLLGGSGGLGGFGDLDSFTERAKDLARFRLGLDKDQAQFSRGLREDESRANFGREQQRMRQEFEQNRDLQGQREGALTGRLGMELDTRKQQQQTDINQQNLATNRAINLARRGL